MCTALQSEFHNLLTLQYARVSNCCHSLRVRLAYPTPSRPWDGHPKPVRRGHSAVSQPCLVLRPPAPQSRFYTARCVRRLKKGVRCQSHRAITAQYGPGRVGFLRIFSQGKITSRTPSVLWSKLDLLSYIELYVYISFRVLFFSSLSFVRNTDGWMDGKTDAWGSPFSVMPSSIAFLSRLSHLLAREQCLLISDSTDITMSSSHLQWTIKRNHICLITEFVSSDTQTDFPTELNKAVLHSWLI